VQLRLCSGQHRWGPHLQKQTCLPDHRQVIIPSHAASSFSRSNCSSSSFLVRLISSFEKGGALPILRLTIASRLAAHSSALPYRNLSCVCVRLEAGRRDQQRNVGRK
jgi:hypothetical protein